MGMYVVSQRPGADTYEQAVYFDGETAEADAETLAESLSNTRPNSEHSVMSADEFRDYSRSAASSDSDGEGE